MGKKNLKSYSPSLPLVPNSSPSRASRATTSIRFTRHSQAAPPPWHSGDKSPSTLDHALSVALASFPLLLFLYLEDRPHWLSHAHLGGSLGLQVTLVPPPPGMALGPPRLRPPCPAFARLSPGGASQPARRPRESLSHTPPPLRAPAVPSRLRLRSESAGLRPLRLREGSGVPNGRGRV